MRNKLLLIFLPVFSVCIAPRGFAQKPFSGKMMKVELGQSIDQLKETMGKPAGINKEIFPSVEYEVWEYSSPDTKPLGFFTLDSKISRVVGRSIEFHGVEMFNVDKFLSHHFGKGKFDKYFPCHSRGHEEVLVDAPHGIFIATRDGKVLTVSWADPHLTKLRIDNFYLKCPDLQPPRK